MTHHIELPRYIALCGNPKAGKSTVQEILAESYGVTPVDDGFPLRKIAVEEMGLTWRQVTTQEGKLETVTVAGKDWVVRDLLGQLGNRLEDLLGPHGIPFLVERTVAEKDGHFSFGSVRRDQGRYYQERGGVVIGVRSPKAGPSPYEFDRYDESLVDFWIDNDGVNPRQLEQEVFRVLKLVEAEGYAWPRLRMLDVPSITATYIPSDSMCSPVIYPGAIRAESFGEGEGTIPAEKLGLAA